MVSVVDEVGTSGNDQGRSKAGRKAVVQDELLTGKEEGATVYSRNRDEEATRILRTIGESCGRRGKDTKDRESRARGQPTALFGPSPPSRN